MGKDPSTQWLSIILPQCSTFSACQLRKLA